MKICYHYVKIIQTIFGYYIIKHVVCQAKIVKIVIYGVIVLKCQLKFKFCLKRVKFKINLKIKLEINALIKGKDKKN